MEPCPLCSCHVRRADAACPHCGARMPGAVALLLALAVGCVELPFDKGAEPPYGVPTTSDSDTDTDADSDSDSDADSDTDPSGHTGSPSGTADTAARGR